MSNLKQYKQYDAFTPLSLKLKRSDTAIEAELSLEQELLQRMNRAEIVEIVIQRHFVRPTKLNKAQFQREAIVRLLNPSDTFAEELLEEEEFFADGFGVELMPPSSSVAVAFRQYGQTELGASALERLLIEDDKYIKQGWRKVDGMLTDTGIEAYGKGEWRPFRIASSGEESDAVTPSGVLMLPDVFPDARFYSTGDIVNPLAILHHELMAHVLPLKAAEGLEPGREMELICIRLESDMLRELGLRQRALNWGKDDGVLNHTLHEPSEQYFQGLVQYDTEGSLIEVDPDTNKVIGPAKAIA